MAGTHTPGAARHRRPSAVAGRDAAPAPGGVVSRRRWLGWVMVAVLGLCIVPASPEENTPSEYDIKAAFVFKFASFVGWPGESLSSNDAIILGVIGDDPFADVLQRSLGGSLINGRKLVIRPVKDLLDARTCQILFVAASEKQRVPAILERVQGYSVLTVGEVDNFCQGGGIINLRKIGKNLRFEVNPAAADRAKLKISSQLLKLAIIVKEDGKGGE
jgi:hypothetical protein